MFLRKALVIIVLALTIGLVMIGTAEARQPLRVGVFLPERSRAAISNHEAQVGRHQDIIMYYEAWGSGGGNIDAERVQWIIDNGSIPMITWEPWKWGGPVTDQPDYSLKKISSGAHDAYLRSYARDIKEINGNVYLRPMHEMNGDWYPWCGTVNGNSPADFIPAWQHIVNIFRQEGADNVRWVWTPNNGGLPDWGTSSFSTYYPGDNYVDFAGIDGYNFGAMEGWSQWELFPDVFKAAYKAIAKITDKPIIIGETASTEAGGNKADWITNAFNEMIANYPRISAIVWFNEDKES
ncbi:MAG: endoglucanase, partial [Actinomycetia bacterium]|nr:endoglucanase [Actinomycetes bacterium]